MRHRRILATAALLAAALATPSLAAPALRASKAFRDVPAGHWAEHVVEFVAIEKAFMVGYPDHTFRGQQPFTRIQAALAMAELIVELEAIAKTRWAPGGSPPFAFQDLPADPKARSSLELIANQYRLFEGLPGLTRGQLAPNHPVTRYDMAWVIDRLLRAGEAKRVVDPSVLAPRRYDFTDVPGDVWARGAVDDVANRYQVMIGFPDATFRGPERLTRYQFAALAAQTFPLIKELVIRTIERKPTPLPTPPPPAPVVTPVPRWHERTPIQVGPLLRANNVVGLGALVRYTPYWGDAFLLAEGRLGVPVCTRDILYGNTLAVGVALPVGRAAYLQPYLGARAVSTTNLARPMLGGALGLVAHHRVAPGWGWFAQADGAALAGVPGGAGGLTGSGGLGVEFYPWERVALTLEGGYGLWPTTLSAPAGTAFATDGAATAAAGVAVGF